jgi:hypothetical protein
LSIVVAALLTALAVWELRVAAIRGRRWLDYGAAGMVNDVTTSS